MDLCITNSRLESNKEEGRPGEGGEEVSADPRVQAEEHHLALSHTVWSRHPDETARQSPRGLVQLCIFLE